MAFSFEWNAAYEGQPSSGLNRALIDDKIRTLSKAVRARMEIGHNFGPYTDKDDGSHRGGHVEVMVKDDSAARDLLVDVRVGGLYLLEDGADLKLCICTSVGPVVWEEVSSLDHGSLDNLDIDTHTQYLKTTGGDVTGLNLGLQKIIMPTDEHQQRGLVQYYHAEHSHPVIGNEDAIKTITRDKLYILSTSQSGVVPAAAAPEVPRYITFDLNGSLVFLPNFYYSGAGYLDGRLVMRETGHIAIRRVSIFGGDHNYRLNYRYVL